MGAVSFLQNQTIRVVYEHAYICFVPNLVDWTRNRSTAVDEHGEALV